MYPEFENQLRSYLETHLCRSDGQTPLNLAESIRYSLLAPGKRIRARMLLACGKMLGLDSKAVLPAAVALEMIHCFTLIHDDLPCMDDDDFRRGMPSNHKKFGESLALLAGDALVPLALDTFMDSQVKAGALIQGLRRLIWATGPRGVIGGQAEESLLDQHSSLEKLKQMHRKKTGALFLAAILIPKDFAEITDESEKGQALTAFADELGLAFQIADDLEDLQETGVLSDLQADPRSILSHMSPKQAQTQTLEGLHRVSKQLIQVFGQQAQELICFSDEIAKKITHALDLSTS
jgi:geranylgeranyl diphosphate synthase type II